MNNDLPFNIPLEQAILGAILHKNNCFDLISDIVFEIDFFDSNHQKLYKKISERLKNGQTADLLTLSNFIKDEKIDYNYVEQLTSSLYPTENIKQYGEILSELSIRRKLISLGKELIENAQSATMPIDKQIEKAEQVVLGINSRPDNYKLVKFFDGAKDVLNFTHKLVTKEITGTNIKTGFVQLDDLLGGMRNGELLILAGRPSMGKTALALNFCTNASLYDKKNVLFISLEMPYEQICLRIISSLSSVPLNNLLHAKISTKAIQDCLASIERFKNMNLFIMDTSYLTPSSLRSISRQMKRQHKIDLIVIDYLQLMENGKNKYESREQEISNISRSLKLLAKEIGVPVIALSQMSRDIEKRKEGFVEPKLSDLRGSGSIEQDADSILFLFKEDENIILSVAKNRNGALGKIKLNYTGSITKFTDH